jgi:transcription elongation factor GreA
LHGAWGRGGFVLLATLETTMRDKPIYVTPGGYDRLRQELQALRTVQRPAVAQRVRHAKEFADALDNADYDNAKQDQAFVEGRIRYLERRLAVAQIIEDHPMPDRVCLGSRVTVQDDTGGSDEYQIVGSVEADPRQGRISDESPVGQALLGRRVGEEIDVTAPGGSFRLTITWLA